VSSTWHSAKRPLCRVTTPGPRQKPTTVSFIMVADGPLPSATFAECQTLGKHGFAESSSVPSVLHSANQLVTERRTLPSAALGKGRAGCWSLLQEQDACQRRHKVDQKLGLRRSRVHMGLKSQLQHIHMIRCRLQHIDLLILINSFLNFS
jgi:hypothetical protein